MKSFVAVIIACLSLTPAARAEPVALLVGDSQAGGLTQEFKSVAKSAGYKPRVDARGGTMTSQWPGWLKADLQQYKPDVVIVVLGTNDAASDPGMIRERSAVYGKIVSMITDSGAKIGWISMPKLHPRIKNVAYVRCKIEEVTPIYFDSSAIDIEMSKDKVHATAGGYKKWMDEAWMWFESKGVVSYCGIP